MASMQDRIALAKQRAAQRAEQAIQDKFDRLEQGKNRDREIDAEMDEIRKKFRALKSEKEMIQADCKRIKEELEGEISAPEGMIGIPEGNKLPRSARVAPMQSPTIPVLYPSQTVASTHGAISGLPHSESSEQVVNPAYGTATDAGRAPNNSFIYSKTPSQPERQTSTHCAQATATQVTTPSPSGQPLGDLKNGHDTIQRARSSQKEAWPENLITTPKVHWHALKGAKGIEGFEVVLLMDGKWTEVSCGVCGKNAMKEGKELRYIGGIIGLYGHVASHFKERQDVSFAERFGHITRREVSQEDVELMMAGKAPKLAIPMYEGFVKPKLKINLGKRKIENPEAFEQAKKLNSTSDGRTEDDEESLP